MIPITEGLDARKTNDIVLRHPHACDKTLRPSECKQRFRIVMGGKARMKEQPIEVS